MNPFEHMPAGEADLLTRWAGHDVSVVSSEDVALVVIVAKTGQAEVYRHDATRAQAVVMLLGIAEQLQRGEEDAPESGDRRAPDG